MCLRTTFLQTLIRNHLLLIFTFPISIKTPFNKTTNTVNAIFMKFYRNQYRFAPTTCELIGRQVGVSRLRLKTLLQRKDNVFKLNNHIFFYSPSI